MKLTKNIVEIANSFKINLDELAFIYSQFFELSWPIEIWPASILKLQRLNLIDADEKLTAAGEILISSCFPESNTEENIHEDKFDEIWLKFPRDDEFRYFSKTRLIRYNKPETKRAYQEVLKTVSHEDLLAALEREIRYRQGSKKENLFKYMKSSVNWFRQAAYEDFMQDEPTVASEDYGKEIV